MNKIISFPHLGNYYIPVVYLIKKITNCKVLIPPKNNKKTIGIRIPDQPIITNIVRELGCPIITTSIVDDDEISGFMTDPEDINDAYSDKVDIIIDGGYGDKEESTVVDCTDNEIVVLREGKGILD